MDLHHRQTQKKFFCFWLTSNVVNALLLSANPGVAQVNVPTLERLPLSDLTGLTFQNILGPRFEVDLPDGTRCVSQDGTPTTFNLYGGLSERNDLLDFDELLGDQYSKNGAGYAMGAVITIPLFSKNSRNCDEAYAFSILNKKIELATMLNQEGLISDEDLKALMQQAKKLLLVE